MFINYITMISLIQIIRNMIFYNHLLYRIIFLFYNKNVTRKVSNN